MPSPDETFYRKADEDKSPAIVALEQELRSLAVDSKTLHERMRYMPQGNILPTKTHALRVSIDANIKEAQELASLIMRGLGGRETALAITKLQEAKMWCGKVLEELGSPLPEEFRDEAK